MNPRYLRTPGELFIKYDQRFFLLKKRLKRKKMAVKLWPLQVKPKNF